ncbi:MAG: recombinase family protein [Mediterraneibacter faecis]
MKEIDHAGIKFVNPEQDFHQFRSRNSPTYIQYVSQGIGSGTIAKRLVELGIKNKRGTVEWHDHGVMGMIKNEKYKGDVLLGKTFIVDPISKRRLANMGEENQYYIRDHHEAIVSREIWDKAEEIRLKRAKPKLMQANRKQRALYKTVYIQQYVGMWVLWS